MNRITLFLVAGIAAIVLVGCASKQTVMEAAPSVPESSGSVPCDDHVTPAANPMVIRDWSDRGIGEIENPTWLNIINLRNREVEEGCYVQALSFLPSLTLRFKILRFPSPCGVSHFVKFMMLRVAAFRAAGEFYRL
jgi:hypothetical protein